MNHKNTLKVGDKIILVVAEVQSEPRSSTFPLGPTIRQWVRFEGDNQNNSINMDAIQDIERAPEPLKVGDKVVRDGQVAEILCVHNDQLWVNKGGLVFTTKACSWSRVH